MSTRAPISRSRCAELQPVQELHGCGDRQQAELVDVEPPDRHRQRGRLQPGSVAGRAGPVGHVLLDLGAHVVGVGLPVAPLQVGDDPLEDGHVAALEPGPVDVRDVEPLALGAVEEDVPHLLGQVGPGRGHVDLVALGDGLDDLVVVLRAAAPPGQQHPFVHRQRRIAHQQRRVDLPAGPEPAARLAGTVRRVEREDARRHLRQRHPVLRAGQVLGEEQAGQAAGGRSPSGLFAAVPAAPTMSPLAAPSPPSHRARRRRRRPPADRGPPTAPSPPSRTAAAGPPPS